MNPQPEEEWQRRLQKLEDEIKSSSVKSPPPAAQKQTSESKFTQLNLYLERSLIWFNSLSGKKKLVVAGVTGLLGFVLLQTLFKLVASVISLAVLAVLVYLGYKFFVSNSFQSKQ